MTLCWLQALPALCLLLGSRGPKECRLPPCIFHAPSCRLILAMSELSTEMIAHIDSLSMTEVATFCEVAKKLDFCTQGLADAGVGAGARDGGTRGCRCGGGARDGAARGTAGT